VKAAEKAAVKASRAASKVVSKAAEDISVLESAANKAEAEVRQLSDELAVKTSRWAM